MKESEIQKEILSYLKDKGHYAVKVIVANKRGVPDIIACIGGKFVGIEVKKPNRLNTITKLQQKNLNDIKKSEGKSFVATSVEDLKKRGI